MSLLLSSFFFFFFFFFISVKFPLTNHNASFFFLWCCIFYIELSFLVQRSWRLPLCHSATRISLFTRPSKKDDFSLAKLRTDFWISIFLAVKHSNCFDQSHVVSLSGSWPLPLSVDPLLLLGLKNPPIIYIISVPCIVVLIFIYINPITATGLSHLPEGMTLPHPHSKRKNGILAMTLNGIWWWGSNSRDLTNVEYPFITITPRSTVNFC